MPVSRHLYKTAERRQVNIPLSEFVSEGRLDIYPDVLSSGYFGISLKGNQLTFSAGDYVGLIPLNSRIALVVEPKMGNRNWLYVASRARARFDPLGFLRTYSLSETISTSLFEFLIRALISQLAEVEQLGLYQIYVPVRETTSFPHGRMLFGESVKTIWSRGNEQSVAVCYYKFSKDNDHNRLLKYSLYVASSYFDLSTCSDRTLRPRLEELSNLLSAVPLDTTLNYIPRVRASLWECTIPGTRAYYADACNTAMLIVENSGIHPYGPDEVSTLSFVVSMPNVFQDYCLSVIQQRLSDHGFSVEDGRREARRHLFSDGSSDSRYAEPDIVILQDRDVRLVVEVKYKTLPNRHDINQAVTYALTYDQDRVVLLCFCGKLRGEELQYMGRVGDSVRVWAYYMDMDAPDLAVTERRLEEALINLLLV